MAFSALWREHGRTRAIRGLLDSQNARPNLLQRGGFNTFLPIFLMKTKLVLAGKSKAEIGAATASALENKELPALAPGAMCYMMSKQQYLNDGARNWHPHVMFLVAGVAEKSWGANLPGSPIIAADNREARVTIFMVLPANGPMDPGAIDGALTQFANELCIQVR